MAGNAKDQELDIILLSTKDSKVIGNLTGGFNTGYGYEYISSPGGFRGNAVPWMSWSPVGDRIAYFARKEKQKEIVLQNVVTKKIEKRFSIKSVDMAESPDISPDGKVAAFAGLRNAIGDIFTIDLETGEIKNVTNDAFGDFAPTWAPDGKSIVYLARVSGNDKLFRLDLATGKKTQLTFGTHDDGGAQFMDDETLVFPSTAVDPNQPISPEVAKNGNIYNVWTLSLKTNELKQFTDALGGNVSPVVLRDENKAQRIAFITYYKGEYGIHTVPAQKEALHTVAGGGFRRARADHRLPAPAQPHARQGQPEGQGTLREAVPRGAAAGQHRRHQRRRLLRRHAGDLHRRARRPAVQLLRRVGLAVPLAVVVVPEPVAPLPVRAAGLLADAVLLCEQRRHLLRGAVRLPEPRRRAVDADLARRHGLRHLPAQPLRAARADGRPDQFQTGLQRSEPAAGGGGLPAGGLRAEPVRRTAT